MQKNLATIPFIQATHWTHATPVQKRLIVLHDMEYPLRSTSADWCGRFFSGKEGSAPEASAHAGIDSENIVQYVAWDQNAWHAPSPGGFVNHYGIGLEHAGYAKWQSIDWSTKDAQAMLDLSAWLAAQLVVKFKIPIRYLNFSALKADGDKSTGITTHRDVSLAFPDHSDHMDPGISFPIGAYVTRVEHYALDVV